ncbi:MAG: TonB-dependent receptor plug domain-containing protein [Candidatus Eremiobacteraeota bacterium]|nr:TonB-dependent receptor plug domain-containing protein [Candidatus Eremiobacteraeota bacterium]
MRLFPVEKVIAHVVSTGARNASYETISKRSSLSKVSSSLLAAMNAVPGLHVVARASGLGAIASIRGQDPSLTSYTINGVSVGSSAASTIDSDLLDQAQVDAASDMVAYSFLSPSLRPLYHASAQQGAFGLSVVKGSFQDTSGVLGIAYSHATRTALSALNGQTYLDQSGATYRHLGAVAITGNYADISFPLGSWEASLSDAVSTSRKLPLPNIRAGPVPAGFGPGEVLTSQANNPLLSINGLWNDYAISASFASWDQNEVDDYATRIVNRTPSPFFSSDTTQGSDLYFGVSTATEATHTTVSYDISRSSYRFSALGLPLSTTSIPRSTITLSQNGRLGRVLLDHLGLSAEIGGGHTSPSMNLAIRWPNKSGVQAYVTANAGRRFVDATALGGAIGMSDPATATFDCADRLISTTSVGVNTASPSAYGFSAGYGRQLRSAWLNLSGYDERIYGTIVSNAPVAASAMSAGALPLSALGQLQAAFSTIGGCAGAAPGPSNIFFSQNVGNVNAEYRGLALQAQLALSRNVELDVLYGLTQARLLAVPSLLQSPLSPYVRYAQLPNVAPSALNITADWHPSHYVEALLNVGSSSRNNQNNLPAYTQISAGVLVQLSHQASLSIIGSNLTNQFVGYFVSPEYAVPLPTYGGEGFPTLADPLPHSALYVQLNLRVASRRHDRF